MLGPVLLFARCVLPSPHAQPDRVDSADTREVNVTKEHGAQLRVLYLVMGKGEASKSLCSGKFSPPPKAWSVCSLLRFLQEESGRPETQLVSGIAEVKRTRNIRMNFSIQIPVIFPNGLV